MLFAFPSSMKAFSQLSRTAAWTILLCAVPLCAQSDPRDADHLHLQYEDNQVRVLWLTLPAHQTTPLLSFAERVTVAANDGTIKIIRRDGASGSATSVSV